MRISIATLLICTAAVRISIATLPICYIAEHCANSHGLPVYGIPPGDLETCGGDLIDNVAV